MEKKRNLRWWLAVVLFSGFLLAFFLDLTGTEIHQWLGLLLGGAALYHLWIHRDWVAIVADRFFDRTSNRARLYYLIDVLLGLGFGIMLLTGLVISTWLNLNYPTGWLTSHIAASITTLGLLVVKLGLHWRWIVRATRSMFGHPPSAAGQAIPQPERREFLRVMGAISLVCLAALTSAGKGLMSLASQEGGSTGIVNAASVSSTKASGTSSSACTVRCNRGCSFPGRCRKYQDSNHNDRCDLGECL